MKINLNFSYRSLNYLGFIFALSLILYALYAQYILNLEACPLCIFQRVAVILAGILFLISVLKWTLRYFFCLFENITVSPLRIGFLSS